jgi:pimeloyl-ACP methyl ester carboxylesterase
MAGKDSRRLRQTLQHLLGGFQPVQWQVLDRHLHTASNPEMRCEQLALTSPEGTAAKALVTGPVGDWRGLPAILYCHAHGNRYGVGADELLQGRPALLQPTYGIALARAGYVAICMDMPCFGCRQSETEQELSKRLLWQGRTLLGQMLTELAGLLDVLVDTFEVDPKRITALGLSMGATHAFWLGALEPRIRAVVQLCALADLGTMVRSGAHDPHGLYMVVPGLIHAASTGQIAGLVAPRPQLVCLGADDPLTPSEARLTAVRDLETAYSAEGASGRLNVFTEAGIGHQETVAMRKKVLAFLAALER